MRSSLVDALNVERATGGNQKCRCAPGSRCPNCRTHMLHLCFISFAFVGICALGPPTGQVSCSDRPGSVVPTTHLAIFFPAN